MPTKSVRRPSKPPKPVVLPTPLPFERSPNFSDRMHGIRPYLIVVHRPIGGYRTSIQVLRDPRNGGNPVSSHIITEGNRTGVDVATQLVPWDKKAWAAASFNSAGYQLEIDDDAWNGDDLGAAFTAARICGFLCRRSGIPAEQSRNPLHNPGIVSHFQLGRAGGGHMDPTTDMTLWRWFLRQCQREYDHGHYRRTWGRGEIVRVK